MIGPTVGISAKVRDVYSPDDIGSNGRIACIKALREMTGLGLAQANDLIKSIIANGYNHTFSKVQIVDEHRIAGAINTFYAHGIDLVVDVTIIKSPRPEVNSAEDAIKAMVSDAMDKGKWELVKELANVAIRGL